MRIAITFVACALIWGSTFLAIRFGNEATPPVWAATIRLALASVLLFGITGEDFTEEDQLHGSVHETQRWRRTGRIIWAAPPGGNPSFERGGGRTRRVSGQMSRSTAACRTRS